MNFRGQQIIRKFLGIYMKFEYMALYMWGMAIHKYVNVIGEKLEMILN